MWREQQEAYRKYDELANRHVETLRRLTKSIQDARIARDHDAIKRAITAYDAALEGYIPGLMAMAKIYWDMENYAQVRIRCGPGRFHTRRDGPRQTWTQCYTRGRRPSRKTRGGVLASHLLQCAFN